MKVIRHWTALLLPISWIKDSYKMMFNCFQRLSCLFRFSKKTNIGNRLNHYKTWYTFSSWTKPRRQNLNFSPIEDDRWWYIFKKAWRRSAHLKNIFAMWFPVERWDFQMLEMSLSKMSEVKEGSVDTLRTWSQFAMENINATQKYGRFDQASANVQGATPRSTQNDLIVI